MPVPAFLHPFSSPRRQDFIEIVGGSGAEVWDSTGRRYVDGMASLWYMNVGYGRTEIAERIGEESAKLGAFHTFEKFTVGTADELAERVVGLSPIHGGRVFLGSGGSDAVDTAMKLARIAQHEAGHPDRTVILSRQHGYHGTHFGGTAAQGLPPNQAGFGALVGDVVNVPGPDIEKMVQAFDDHDGRVAAVVAEPLQGAGGVYPPPDGYLEGLRRLCDEAGAFLVFDEVICGFGRLGSWFGAQHYGVTPDMIIFAKAVTSGYQPLGGVITGPVVNAALEANDGFVLRHGYTYSGHPVACAAGLACIDIMEREELLARVPGIAARLSTGLQALRADGLVSDVRGEGGVWGVGLDEGRDAYRIRDAMLENGVIVRPLPGNSLAMCPPLVITDEQIDQIVDAMALALQGG